MRKNVILTILLCVAGILTASGQHTIESIRKDYQGVQEWISQMSDNFPTDGIPSEYYHLRVEQNLPGTGPHHEDIRMYYGEEEEGGWFCPIIPKNTLYPCSISRQYISRIANLAHRRICRLILQASFTIGYCTLSTCSFFV